MRDVIADERTLADYDLAKVMGYGYPDDYPKWTTKNLTREQDRKLDSERYRWREGKISLSRYEAFKSDLYRISKEGYDLLYPRRPKHWDKVLDVYLSLPEQDRPTDKEQIQRLIYHLSPEAVRDDRYQEKLKAQARAEARKIRNLPENKNQEWNWKAERKWAETDEVDSEGRNKIITKARKGSKHDHWYRGWFTRFIDYLDRMIKPGYKQDERDISLLSLQSSWDKSRLAGGEGDNAHYNSSELSDGYGFGALPPPGKKKSGRTRNLLGEK